LYRWLTDENYSKRYGLAIYNDMAFLEIIKVTFICKDSKAMLDLSKNVYIYVANKMGGINIDDFVLRGPCD
jgi:hypothetical protein